MTHPPQAAGEALAHLRHAYAGFLALDDPTGQAGFLAADCLEVTHLFAEVGVLHPGDVDSGLAPLASLDQAVALLDRLPIAGPWAAIHAGIRALHAKAHS